jgi:hypothetical protein
MLSRLHILALALPLITVATGGRLVAQSLGEVAREEEARRKDIKQPAKIYTNKDLVSVPPPASAPEGSKPPSAAVPATGDRDGDKSGDADPRSGDGKGPGGKGQGAPKDQAYWSGRMKALNTQLDRNQIFADSLQTRINSLTTDFSARDDPAQRALLARDRQKALDELDRVRKAIDADKKAIADLQEDARRSSVPPGWLR